MSYSRQDGEDPQKFRTRITEAYERYEAPVREYRTRGRKVPLPVQEATRLAKELDRRAAEGQIPALRMPRRNGHTEQLRPADSAAVLGEFPLRGARGLADPPSRAAFNAAFEALGSNMGLLRISFQYKDGWSAFKPPSSGQNDIVFTNGQYARFYSLWKAIQANEDYEREDGHDTAVAIAIELVPLLDAAAGEAAGMWDGKENCALRLLTLKFPSKASALNRVKLADDRGFYAEQAFEVAKILKRNVEVRNRAGGRIYITKRPDGSLLYQGKTRGVQTPSVVIVDFDHHAVEDVPKPPADGELILADKLDFFSLKERFGRDCRIWPLGETTALVEASQGIAEQRLPYIVRQSGEFSKIEARAKELGVLDYKLASSPFGIETRYWREQCGFAPTPAELRELWVASQFYPVPYYNQDLEAGLTIDLNRAYESAPQVTSRDLFARYGFPTAEGVIVRDPPMEVLQQTGLVVAQLDIEQCHPWIRFATRGASRGVFTTMRLAVWLEKGAVVITRLELAVVSGRTFPALTRPEGNLWLPPTGDGSSIKCEESDNPLQSLKRWGARAIGRLVPSVSAATSLRYCFVEDEAEAASIIHTLREEGTLGDFSFIRRPCTSARPNVMSEEDLANLISKMLADIAEAQAEAPTETPDEPEGYYKIGQRVLSANGAYHVYSYYLDYTAAAIDREVLSHPWSDIVRVKTDAITLAAGKVFTDNIKIGTEFGEWKFEASFCKNTYPPVPPRPVPELPDAPPYWSVLFSQRPVVIEGPPGYGKSHYCLENLREFAHVVLTPTRKMRKKLVEQGHRAYTWQWALKPQRQFEPARVRIPRGSIVYIPEIGVWSKEDVETILPWLVDVHHCRVIADGDRKQMKPVVGQSPWGFLDTWATSIPRAEIDYRSKDDGLAELKLELRECRQNSEVFDRIVRALGASSYEQFLREWHPRDFVYVTIHDLRRKFQDDLARIHREKYPGELVRIRYSEKAKDRSGEEAFIALGEELPAAAELAYATTYSSCQGETASAYEDGYLPRVWLADFFVGEHFENAAYVGATRVERFEQLQVIRGQVPAGTYFGREYKNEDYLDDIDDEPVIELEFWD